MPIRMSKSCLVSFWLAIAMTVIKHIFAIAVMKTTLLELTRHEESNETESEVNNERQYLLEKSRSGAIN